MDDRGHTVVHTNVLYMSYVFFNALNCVQMTPFNAVKGMFQHVGTRESKVVTHHMGVSQWIGLTVARFFNVSKTAER